MTILAWCRVGPTGNWNNDPAANPATGTGGIDLTATGDPPNPLGPIVHISGGGQQTFNFGNAAFAGVVPAGFTAGWPGSGAGGWTAFDPSLVGGPGAPVFSNNNRTYHTTNFGAAGCQVYAADLKTSGKYYFEMHYDSHGALSVYFGGGIGRQYLTDGTGLDYAGFVTYGVIGTYRGFQRNGGIALIGNYPNFAPDPFHTTFGALAVPLIQQPPTEAFTYQPGVTVCWAIDLAFSPPAGNQISGVGDLWYGPTTTFIDLRASSNRRLFVGLDGSTQFLGDDGSRPFGDTPPIFLTLGAGQPADLWAQNRGSGGSFTIAEPPALQLFTGDIPPCSGYTIDGNVPPNTPQGADPEIRLSVSDDGGRTYSLLQKWRSMGKIGEYTKRLRWLKMGMFRERTIRLEVTDPVRRNIVGLYLDVTVGLD